MTFTEFWESAGADVMSAAIARARITVAHDMGWGTPGEERWEADQMEKAMRSAIDVAVEAAFIEALACARAIAKDGGK